MSGYNNRFSRPITIRPFSAAHPDGGDRQQRRHPAAPAAAAPYSLGRQNDVILGRDSVTINSGGEKIFAEEIEEAIRSHPAVYDAIVVGRPSERWGQEVVGLVRVRKDHSVDEQELIDACREHVARYKLPKAILFKDEIVRSPSGKADYRWAKRQVS